MEEDNNTNKPTEINNEPIESKIERSRFKQTCPRCSKEIKGTSRKQLRHTFEMHLLYCKKGELK